jgi:hypothetical protein
MNPLDPNQTIAGHFAQLAAAASKSQPGSPRQRHRATPNPQTSACTATSRISSAGISFLAPSSAFQSEGEEVILPALPAEDAPRHQWLKLLEAMVGQRSLRFVVDATGVRPVAEPAEADAMLTLAHLGRNAAGNAPVIAVKPITTLIEWTEVIAVTARQTGSEHYLGGVNDAVRIFLSATRDAALEACDGLDMLPLPLFTFHASSPTDPDAPVVLAFIGLLLAPEDELQCLRSDIPHHSWTSTRRPDSTAFIIVDESEVEGHGLREVLASAALMAMVLSTTPSTHAGPAEVFGLRPKDPISVVAKHYGLKGEVLPVKSQKLVQPAPRIYDRRLAVAPDTERLVLVDISAQRAYLFVNGSLVFDTPVSTASKGRHTPRGTFTISEKIKSGKHSTLYGSAMPYWQRLGESAIGMHTGHLPGYPASHGCVRLPDESANFMFNSTKRGTVVQVINQWTPPANQDEMIAKK